MKEKKSYICQQCSAKFAGPYSKCPNCGEWNSITEEIITDSKKNLKLSKRTLNNVITLKDVSTEEEFRLMTKINEFDRVLGGGIILGSVILVGGDPGIGKSTLMLQICEGLKEYNTLYVTGEESLKQIKYRAQRLKGVPDDLMLMAETNIEQIEYAIRSTGCKVAIIDSIQSVYSDRIDSTPGSVIQVRECAAMLTQTAKTTGTAIFIIGHVTKEGFIAGPKILEHIVDTVLQFEGEKTYSYRILRSLKNRYGSTNEIGIFEMNEQGLREVTNPSEIFLCHRNQNDPGIAIVAAIEGTRPILLEVQALVTPTGYSVPQRTSNGYDIRRLQMLLAVLEKRLGEKFRQNDVFVNVAGGIYLNDPAVDLGIATALLSSLHERPISSKTALIGEIGLTGEIRSVSALEQRINESQKLGFERVIIPKINRNNFFSKNDISIITVDRVSLALNDIFL